VRSIVELLLAEVADRPRSIPRHLWTSESVGSGIEDRWMVGIFDGRGSDGLVWSMDWMVGGWLVSEFEVRERQWVFA